MKQKMGKAGNTKDAKENKEYREYGEYREQVQAMLLWYDRYIRLKLTGMRMNWPVP